MIIMKTLAVASFTAEDSDNPITTEADWNHAIVSRSMDDLNQQMRERIKAHKNDSLAH